MSGKAKDCRFIPTSSEMSASPVEARSWLERPENLPEANSGKVGAETAACDLRHSLGC
jgi:hypothetical protein